MGLQLLLGGSGFGKSHFMYAQVIEASIAHPEKNYFIVVPEQYTMQIQKNIVQMHPDHGTMNIDVVSFGRLAHRIFDELGMDTLTVLDDIGKSMVVRRVVNKEKSKLRVFQGNAGKAGFVSEMKSTISELMQYHISPADLTDAVDKLQNKPALSGKLTDIERIYSGFMDYISEKYITTEQILDKLVSVISKSALVRRSVFYLDEFTGFTPAQYDLITEILKLDISMQIALTVDTREDVYKPGKTYDLFYLTKETIFRLNRVCRQVGAQREEDIVLPEVKRYRAGSPLSVLERNIYRTFGGHDDTLKEPLIYGAATGQVEIYAMHTPSEELSYISQEILRLCRQGMRYRDIAVVTADLNAYGHIAENAMKRAGIPYFIDQSKDVLSNGYVEFIRALIDVMAQDFSYSAVFRYLKTGWTDVVMEDIDRLENYVLATGIRGHRMWSSVFVRSYKGLAKGELAYINQIRESVMIWLEPVWQAFSAAEKTAGGYSKAILEFVSLHNMESRVESKRQWFEQESQLAMAKEYQQIYKVIEDIFKRMDEIIADEVMTVKTYKDILDAGLNEARVGIIPPGVDQVMVGDILRTRLDHVKVLFFVGVNEGIVPGTVKDGGLINDKDKDVLKDYQFELAPTGKQSSYTEKFYIYSMLSKPSEKLIISYTKTDSSSRSMRPSPLISRIQAILPQVRITDIDMVGADAAKQHIYSVDAARKYLTKYLSVSGEVQLPKFWYDLYLWMDKDDTMQVYMQRLMMMAFGVHEDLPLSRSAVRALYGNVLEGSVTMLEQYAACAYAHFLTYGLGLEERREYHLSAPDLGTLFHRALELFSKKLSDSEYNWHSVPDDVRKALAKQCVDDIVSDDKYMILMDNFRNRFMVQRLLRMVQRTLWAVQMQVKRGVFEPTDYEIRFDSSHDQGTLELALSENEVLKLVGVIDRLDMYEAEDKMYVRIIDYKSGSKKFDMAALFYGLQLQLVVYMEAAMDMKSRQSGGKKVIPAGILYYNINDPMISVDSASIYGNDEDDQLIQGQIDHEILKSLKMNGLVNDSREIIQMMDQHFEGTSDIIPVALNKNGTLSKNSSVASTAHFEDLFAYTAQKVQSLGQEIMQGNIGVHPYDRGAKGHGCTYCPYRSVCGYDVDMEGFEPRRIRELSKDDVWRKIAREEESHGGKVD